jgi:hypothetical protein
MDKSKAMCNGCRDDFYNHNVEGGCWSYASAAIVQRVEIGTWEPPPYHPSRKKKVLSCYHRDGFAMLKLDDFRVRDTPFSVNT